MKYELFVDGSFNKDDLSPASNKVQTHGGVVVYLNDERTMHIHIVTDMVDFTTMMNVGGEILAAWAGLYMIAKFWKDNNPSEKIDLTITYDYQGIEDWVTGAWRAKKPATKWYAQVCRYLRDLNPNMRLSYNKVEGHTGVKGNVEADRLASYDMTGVTPDTTLVNFGINDYKNMLKEVEQWLSLRKN